MHITRFLLIFPHGCDKIIHTYDTQANGGFVVKRFAILLALMLTLMALTASLAEGTVTTTVLMRVSRMTQSAVVNAGEDLTIEVRVDGVNPSSYQWYFNDIAIEGATQKVYNLVNAKAEDSGVYRMDAFDDAGRMVVSVDVSVRVVDDAVPKSGDSSLPVGAAFAGLAVCGALLAVLLRRRAAA